MASQNKLVHKPLVWNIFLPLITSFVALLAGSHSAAQAKDIFRLNTQGAWDNMPGCANDVGIGARGSVWVVGCDLTPGGYGIHHWQDGNNWRKIHGGAKQIAVSPNGKPVVVNDNGVIFQGDGEGAWKQLPGCANDVGIGANGALWIVGCNPVFGGYGIYQWTASGWRGIDGGAVVISVLPDGRPVVVNNADEIFIGNGQGNWQRLDGGAKDISVGADGSLWVIGNNVESHGYGIYQRTGATWKKIPGSAVRIAVNPQGAPWVVNQDLSTNIWVKPVENYTITSEWGWRGLDIDCQLNGCYHTGIDLATGNQTPPVKAVKAGIVSRVGFENGGYGNFIYIDHGNGFQTRYAHLSAVYAKVGDQVTNATVIGAVGRTGAATGNHLHFEVRVNGEHKNPRDYIQF